jgi:hypothetical protein
LKQVVIEAGVDGFDWLNRHMDNFVNGGRQLRPDALLFCALGSGFRSFEPRDSPKDLEADRLQPESTVSKTPTGTAEERAMCGAQG